MNQGHDYLIIDDPDKPGQFLSFDFYPEDGAKVGINPFSAHPAVVRERSLTPQQVADLVRFSAILRWRTQSPANDKRTIEKARELKRLAETRQLKYNFLQARNNTLNCIGFTQSVLGD